MTILHYFHIVTATSVGSCVCPHLIYHLIIIPYCHTPQRWTNTCTLQPHAAVQSSELSLPSLSLLLYYYIYLLTMFTLSLRFIGGCTCLTIFLYIHYLHLFGSNTIIVSLITFYLYYLEYLIIPFFMYISCISFYIQHNKSYSYLYSLHLI